MLNFLLGILFCVMLTVFISQIVANQKLKAPPKFLFILPLDWKEGLGWILFFGWIIWFAYSHETPPIYYPTVNTMGI
jgi:hypothetical protein